MEAATKDNTRRADRQKERGRNFLPGGIKGLETKLNLLLAEFRAGNTSTRNEIVFIIDELLRRKNDCNSIEI